MNVAEYADVKKNVSDLERQINQSEGATTSLLEQLHVRFKIKSLKDATLLLGTRRNDSDKYEVEINDLFSKIEQVMKDNQ